MTRPRFGRWGWWLAASLATMIGAGVATTSCGGTAFVASTVATDPAPTRATNGDDYEAGYEDGYAAGYEDGYHAGQNAARDELRARSSHSDGYDEGYRDGYDAGYDDGYDDGYTAETGGNESVPASDAPVVSDEPDEPDITDAPEVGRGDDAVIAGAQQIARGCAAFAGSYGYGPSGDDVLPTGAVAQFVDPWPTNPYTGQPMTQSYGPGDYSFGSAISMGSGQPYRGYVTGYLADGSSYPVEFQY